MFKFEELCELIRLVGSTGVAAVEIEHAGGRVRIDGAAPVAAATPTADAVPSAAPSGAEPAAPPSAAPQTAPDEVAADDDADLYYITSPIVGTFYRAPNPDSDPYVKVGDVVDGGQTLCIVEAMKLMNEIESDVAGTVVKVFPDNAQPVEFGERLFAIRSA